MSSNEKRAVIVGILAELDIKSRHMLQVYYHTKELEEHMQNDDRVHSRIALSERAGELEKASECDLRIEKILRAQKVLPIIKVITLLKGGVEESGFSKDEDFTDLIEQISRLKLIWQRAKDIDERISKRIIGKKSFYSELDLKG